MGANAVWHLARRGVRVLGLERFGLAHDRGSSHGETRAIRTAYFEDPAFVPLVQAAFQRWRELEADSGQDLLTLTGILELGRPDGDLVAGALRSCREYDLAHEVLSAEEVQRRYPLVAVPEGFVGLFEAAGGYLRPEACIKAALECAMRRGAALHFGEKVLRIEPRMGGVSVLTEEGEYVAERVVVAAGAWTANLVPELQPVTRITRQVLAWFRPAADKMAALERMPVFAIDDDTGAYYGFPLLADGGLKMAKHGHLGEQVDPDEPRRPADAGDEAVIRAFADRYLPGAAGPAMRLATCLYTLLPGDFFLIDNLPRAENVIVCSACSGHGFKFASAIGDMVAQYAVGMVPDLDLSSFSFAALAERRGGMRRM